MDLQIHNYGKLHKLVMSVSNSYAVLPNSWRNRKAGESKLKIKEMGSRYFFILLYCLIENFFSRGDYKKVLDKKMVLKYYINTVDSLLEHTFKNTQNVVFVLQTKPTNFKCYLLLLRYGH